MLDSTRPAVGAQAVGIARAAFEYLLERVRGGSLHGTPMASHQHIAFELAEMEMEIKASRLLVHRAAWMADHHMENVAEASMAKAHAARTAQGVTTRAMVLLGEEALEPGHPVEKWYRDAKIYDIFEGTGQIQRRIIAKHLTGQNPTRSMLPPNVVRAATDCGGSAWVAVVSKPDGIGILWQVISRRSSRARRNRLSRSSSPVTSAPPSRACR